MGSLLTTEIFIEKANKKHNNKYDYSLTDYKSAKTKIKIICPEHGIFEQFPYNHSFGKGCLKCGLNKNTRNILAAKEFIDKAISIHKDKYDYSLVEYIRSDKKVILICKIHGQFLQTPAKHLNRNGCIKCSHDKSRKDDTILERFIQIHGEKYDYSKMIYFRRDRKVVITCKIHGNFFQTPNEHLQGHGCAKCAGNNRLTTEEFIKRSNLVHNYLYDYSKSEIINSTNPIIIICKKHGEFNQIPTVHYIKKCGCPNCKLSKGEEKIKVCLDEMNIKYEQQKKFIDCLNIKELPFDFYLPDYNLCIEYDGKQHFDKDNLLNKKEGSFEDRIKCDYIKNEYCLLNNIQMVRIPYTDFDKININYIKELLCQVEI
jgi:hypothetical protein